MKTHANARLSLKGRELLVARVEDAGWSLIAAAEAAGISDLANVLYRRLLAWSETTLPPQKT